MDTFPFDSWEQAGAAAPDAGFFTFGDTGAVILVILMIVVTAATIIAGARLEGRKLDEQAERLRSSRREEV